MKSIIKRTAPKEISFVAEVETLTLHEMYRIRGGNADEKIKTKDIDIYDTRDL